MSAARRFEWASGATEPAIGWAQLPIPAKRPPEWLTPGAWLAGAVLGGLAWRWSEGAPTKTRLALLVLVWGVIAVAWFHRRQLARGRIPATRVWPAVVIAFVGFGPLAFLVEPSLEDGMPELRFTVLDERGGDVQLPPDERLRLVRPWREASWRASLSDMRDERRVERIRELVRALYPPENAAAIEALDDADLAARSARGELGVPLLLVARPDVDAERFRFVTVRLGLEAEGRAAAAVTASDGARTLRFRLVTVTERDVGRVWRFKRERIALE